jgi:predicted small lipoprotein YifL
MFTSIHKGLILKLSILAAFAFSLSGCGRKAPPVAPRPAPPPAVNDLSRQMQEDTLKLNWTIPKHKGKRHPDLEGFFVYRSQKPLSESECPDCPLQFKLVADIGIETIKISEKKKNGHMTYRETLAKGYRYIYKVVAYDDSGSRFDDSNLVTFKY